MPDYALTQSEREEPSHLVTTKQIVKGVESTRPIGPQSVVQTMGRHIEALKFLDILFGDEPALTPEQTFYHSSNRLVQVRPRFEVVG